MLESIFQLYLNQKPVQFKNRNINSINTILKLYNRQSIQQSINSKTSINKTNAQPTRTYTLNYQLIKHYRTKTKTLKIKLTILKFSSFSTTLTICLKLTINLTARNIWIAKQPFNKNKPNHWLRFNVAISNSSTY